MLPHVTFNIIIGLLHKKWTSQAWRGQAMGCYAITIQQVVNENKAIGLWCSLHGVRALNCWFKSLWVFNLITPWRMGHIFDLSSTTLDWFRVKVHCKRTLWLNMNMHVTWLLKHLVYRGNHICKRWKSFPCSLFLTYWIMMENSHFFSLSIDSTCSIK